MGHNETTTMIANTTGEGELMKANVTEWRPRIEHAQIMTMKDLRRTNELGSKYRYALALVCEQLILLQLSPAFSQHMRTYGFLEDIYYESHLQSLLRKSRTSDMWYAETRLVSYHFRTHHEYDWWILTLNNHLRAQIESRALMHIGLCCSEWLLVVLQLVLNLGLHASGSPKHVIPLGSDFPVESVNPLLGFYAAVSRLSVDGTSPHGDGGW